jgi:hypothetical protein
MVCNLQIKVVCSATGFAAGSNIDRAASQTQTHNCSLARGDFTLHGDCQNALENARTLNVFDFRRKDCPPAISP